MLRPSALAIILLAVLSSSGYCGTVSDSVRTGNELFLQGKYDEALKEYKAAQVEAPKDDRIMFNLGNTHYKLGQYDEALSEFNFSAADSDPKIQAQSHYNAGNTLYRTGKLEEAVDQYLKALENNPNDEDAKFNLEFVRREMRRRMNEQQQQQQGKKGQEQPKEGSQNNQPEQQGSQQDQGQQQEPSGEGKQEKQNSGRQEDKQPGSLHEAEPQQQPGAPEENGGQQAVQTGQETNMDKESVQRWLDAIESESAENMKDFLRKQQHGEVGANPRDW